VSKLKLLSILFLLLFTLPFLAAVQSLPKVKWTVKHPFEQKVFIENKGQYEIDNKVASKDILFGAQQGGLQYYFTNNAIWIKRDVAVKRTDEEMEQLKQQSGEAEEKELEYKMVPQFHQINFIGTNPAAEITSENEVSWYYNFTINKNVPVKAQAFKKLTYINLYPGIDMEFYFPKDSTGFEYSFIVHPGADVSQIKINYPLNEGIQFGLQKNLSIQSTFCAFTDVAPAARQLNKNIDCSFSLNNSIEGFSVSEYDKTKTLFIDPWDTTPNFTGFNDAYDVDWDNAGNCYIYGGDDPWQLIKYDGSGVMLWSYTEAFNSQFPQFGGFAVDRNSQSAYIGEGVDDMTGAKIIKVNGQGVQIAMFYGNINFREIWQIAFSRCMNNAVLAGGGVSSPSYQACYLDTTLTNLSPVNILKVSDCCHDLWGITLDDYGNCYTATLTKPSSNSFANKLFKLPIPSLAPTTWMVSDDYNFQEIGSIQFAVAKNNGVNYVTNSFNGMAISSTDLFTYDSYVLKKWSSTTGAEVDSVTVNTTKDNSKMYWAGLTSDDCDNIFLGSDSDIYQYDGNLNLMDSIKQLDTIFDVSLGNNNILYACGAGFVSALQVTLPSCNRITFSNNISNVNCPNPTGSVIATPMGAVSPYTITWNTIPQQTGATAINLSAGTYIATIIDQPVSCIPDTVYDTIQMINSAGKDTISINSPTICSGESVILIAKGATIYAWSPGIGLNATTGDSVIANPTISTTYTVIGTNSGCADTAQAIVSISAAPYLIIRPQDTSVCDGQSVTLIAPISGSGYLWNPLSTLSSDKGDTVTATPSVTTTYTVTGNDSLGCTASGLDTVIVTHGPTKPTITQNGNILISSATQGNQWLRNDTILQGATNQTYTVTIAGYYQVIAKNPVNGCSTTSDPTTYITPTGIEQLSVNSEQVSIYPNPTGGEINIVSAKNIDEVTVSNLLGQTVLKFPSGDLGVKQTHFTFELKDEGMYFVTVTSDNETVTRKVVVVK
jgi:hypothetical protein